MHTPQKTVYTADSRGCESVNTKTDEKRQKRVDEMGSSVHTTSLEGGKGRFVSDGSELISCLCWRRVSHSLSLNLILIMFKCIITWSKLSALDLE